jgi:flagellar biosynthesis/type III secretory pathway protein FliH
MGREEGRSEGHSTGLSEGLSEGLSQGEIVAMRRAVVRTLDAKFQTVPPGLVEAVARVEDIARLGELLTQAVRAQTLEEFAQNL